MSVVYNTVINQGANWFINFQYKQPATITNITSNGTTVSFTATNGFFGGQTVNISGVLPSQYNFQAATIASVTGSSFTVTNPATGTYISGGIATVPINLTGYTAALQIRSLPEDPTAVLSLSTGGNGITIPTPTDGTVEVQATAAQTRAIIPGTYYYDIEITSTGGIVYRLAQGQVVVSAEVTR
jgi:hypothetical protein